MITVKYIILNFTELMIHGGNVESYSGTVGAHAFLKYGFSGSTTSSESGFNTFQEAVEGG